MAPLASHINVWETCLQLMQRRGYSLTVSCADPDDDDSAPDTWHASKDGFTFVADDPVQLLGLTAVYEDVRPDEDRPYWWSATTDRTKPGLYDRLIDQALALEEARLPRDPQATRGPV